MTSVLERRGLRNRDWAVTWEYTALQFLLDRGFSPQMGARPLKRATDTYFLAPLAATIVEHRFPDGDPFLFVKSESQSIQVEFVDPDDEPPDHQAEDSAVAQAAQAKLARVILAPT